MFFVINPRSGRVTLDGKQVVLDTHYQVDDEHRAIVRSVGPVVVIQLKQGKKVVQTASIPQHVSAVSGRNANGQPTPQVFMVDIVPDQPIFPQGPVIQRLIELGIKAWRIHVMNADQPLYEHIASQAAPTMVCGTAGVVSSSDVAGTGDLTDHVAFVVQPAAKWAILVTSGSVNSVYLWPEVDADGLMTKIAELMPTT